MELAFQPKRHFLRSCRRRRRRVCCLNDNFFVDVVVSLENLEKEIHSYENVSTTKKKTLTRRKKKKKRVRIETSIAQLARWGEDERSFSLRICTAFFLIVTCGVLTY